LIDQAVRTSMAWQRTSFGFLANGALLMVKSLHGVVGPEAFIPAALAGGVAGIAWVIAMRRRRVLQRDPPPARVAARRQVHFIGLAVLLLSVVVSATQLM
jgi:hypothetical protein